MHTEIAVYLDGVTPEVDRPKYGTVREPILRLGDADLVFPADPEEAAGLALDLIDCLNEIRTDALRAAIKRQDDWDASRLTPFQEEVGALARLRAEEDGPDHAHNPYLADGGAGDLGYRASMADAGLSAKVRS